MGSMFLLADRRLREYSDLYSQHDNRTLDEAYLYLHTILSSYVDADGDGSITKSEMLVALRSKGVGFNLTTPNGVHHNSKLWCKTASLRLENCYEESGYFISDTATVGVEDIFQDAWVNFKFSLKHRFDGSGVSVVTAMKSWYPDPQMSLDVCKSYDRSWHRQNYSRIETSYTISSLRDISNVCGYTNGMFNKDEFSASGRLGGNVTSFTDYYKYDKVADVGNYPKRIYCIYLQFKSSNSVKSFECSVGLSPDGMPV